jgi:hypothetical protein
VVNSPATSTKIALTGLTGGTCWANSIGEVGGYWLMDEIISRPGFGVDVTQCNTYVTLLFVAPVHEMQRFATSCNIFEKFYQILALVVGISKPRKSGSQQDRPCLKSIAIRTAIVNTKKYIRSVKN